MGTNSQIFYEKSPNEFHGISCNYDGHLNSVGRILYQHYQDQTKIEKLISLGDISSLDKECETSPRYEYIGMYDDAENRHFGYTCAYHRDMGRKLYAATIKQGLNSFEEYFHAYVWRGDKWFTYDYEKKEWITLKDALIDLAKEYETEFDNRVPQTIELEFSYDDYQSNIYRGFLIIKKDSISYNKGDYIKFKASKNKKKYELLLQVREVIESDGIKEDYQLIQLSKPPKDFAWYNPVRYV